MSELFKAMFSNIDPNSFSLMNPNQAPVQEQNQSILGQMGLPNPETFRGNAPAQTTKHEYELSPFAMAGYRDLNQLQQMQPSFDPQASLMQWQNFMRSQL
jgi:hypothetical protein